MPSFKNSSLRYLFGRRPIPFWQYQRRWARVHDVRFLATNGVQERILDRYKDKLDRRAKELVSHFLFRGRRIRRKVIHKQSRRMNADDIFREGHKTITDLKEAYRERIANLRKHAVISGATSPLGAIKSINNAFQPPPPPPPPLVPLKDDKSATESPSSLPPGIKSLSSFIDIPKTLDLPQKEIEYIWRLRHSSNPNSLCAIVPSNTYTTMAETARKHPQFILPLPRESEDLQGRKQGGAEIHFMQWTFPHPSTATVLFTHLAEYKLRGEYATPHTTISL